MWLLVGSGNSMISTPSSRLLARASDDSTRGYIYTAQFSLSHASFLMTYPIAGWLGASSLALSAVVLAGIAFTSGIIASRGWRNASTHPSR